MVPFEFFMFVLKFVCTSWSYDSSGGRIHDLKKTDIPLRGGQNAISTGIGSSGEWRTDRHR